MIGQRPWFLHLGGMSGSVFIRAKTLPYAIEPIALLIA